MEKKHARRKARKEAAQGNTWLAFSALTRVIICIVIGALCAGAVGYYVSWTYAPLILWDISALTLLAGLWLSLHHFDPKQTEQHARAEDPGRGVADIVLTLSSIASLVAVVVLMVQNTQSSGWEQYIPVVLGIISIVTSWAVVHTISMLRYADLYFSNGKKGIDFNTNEAPTYSDFAYVAFTIGMTYQVADTSLTTSEMRKAVRAHALLSYLFGTAIIAATINFVVSLAH